MASKGFYKHWKGDVYFVVGVGQIDRKGPRIVVYESTQSVADRVLRMHYEADFEGWAVDDAGSTVLDEQNQPVKRFVRIT